MWAHPPLFLSLEDGVSLNLQQQLYKAWRVQKSILQIHEQKQDLRNSVLSLTEEHTELTTTEKELRSSIELSSNHEEELDEQVIRYSTELKKTKEQMNFGVLDFEVGTEQCRALEEKIDGLEEEYFLLVDEREGKEKELFVVQQKIKLRIRSIQDAKLEEQLKLPELNGAEEKHEETLETLLSRVPVECQSHFEKLRFTHSNLVSHLRDSFCGACGTKQPLKIVGEITRTTGVHICGNCKAFCIAP